MAKYSFVGFPVQPDSTVEIPDDSLIVGANFTVGNLWQIMCLVPKPTTKESPPAGQPEGAEEDEGELEEGDKHADVPPES